MNVRTWIEDIDQSLRSAENPELAEGMSAYKKGQFTYLGLKKPLRVEKTRQQIRSFEGTIDDLCEVVLLLWEMKEREFQYVAMDLLERYKRLLKPEHLPLLKSLIISKSGWDTVDKLSSNLVGFLILKNLGLRDEVFLWGEEENMWLQRCSILFQLTFKEQTDLELLQAAIERHRSSKEFFLQKAIGWSLRQYARTNATWVLQFVEEIPLASLSKREALKHLK